MGESLILETDRLLLRKFTLNDVGALEKVIGDPVAMEYYAAPFSREEVEAWITRNMGRYEKDGCGLWAMELRSSGELIGDCGCVETVSPQKLHMPAWTMLLASLVCGG